MTDRDPCCNCSRAFFDKRLAQEVEGEALGEVSADSGLGRAGWRWAGPKAGRAGFVRQSSRGVGPGTPDWAVFLSGQPVMMGVLAMGAPLSQAQHRCVACLSFNDV